MSVVETETHGQIFVIRMNRPDSLNALNHAIRMELSEAWNDFQESNKLEVAIFTGAGRGFGQLTADHTRKGDRFRS